MSCLRCSLCDLNLPVWGEHKNCPVCHEETWRLGDDEYDSTWKEQVARLQKARRWRAIPDAIIEPIPDVSVLIHVVKGQLWIEHEELLQAGYRYLEDFSIVKVRGDYYELYGIVGEEDEDIPGGAWWVGKVEIEAEVAAAFKDTPVLDFNPGEGVTT